jgi:hypothetical protein
MVRLALAIRCEPPFFYSVYWAALRVKNSGWRIALNFCFFLFKQKEKEKIAFGYFCKSIRKRLNLNPPGESPAPLPLRGDTPKHKQKSPE